MAWVGVSPAAPLAELLKCSSSEVPASGVDSCAKAAPASSTIDNVANQPARE